MAVLLPCWAARFAGDSQKHHRSQHKPHFEVHDTEIPRLHKLLLTVQQVRATPPLDIKTSKADTCVELE